MIRVKELLKRFGQTVAVNGISLEIAKGEVVGFAGPNGAGKTTTLRVLTCFHPATSGTAHVGGIDVFTDPIAVRRQIGYLPENVPIYPDLRVAEYLHYRAELKGVPRRQRRGAVEEVMERCGVTEVRRKLVGHVSRGYRQRVGLADALVSKPPILILDEPTAGLDPNQRRRMKALVRELSDEHTVMFSSHILSEVEDVSTRMIIIHKGEIRADGTPDELLSCASGRHVRVTASVPGRDLIELLTDFSRGSLPRQVCEEGDFLTVEFPVSVDVDPRDDVFRCLIDAGAVIRELRLNLPSLEDYFRSVTEDGLGSEVGAEIAKVSS